MKKKKELFSVKCHRIFELSTYFTRDGKHSILDVAAALDPLFYGVVMNPKSGNEYFLKTLEAHISEQQDFSRQEVLQISMHLFQVCWNEYLVS